MEYKKIDLGVKIILPKGYCALLINKSSARVKFGIHVFLGLIDIGFHDYMQMVIQNVSDEKVVLPAGIAVCQLLVIKSKIPKFEIGWEDLESRNGSFGSTGNNFEQVQANLCRVEHENVHLVRNNVLGAIDLIDPREINLGNINLKFLGNNEKRADQLTELLDFEKRTFCNYNAILEKNSNN